MGGLKLGFTGKSGSGKTTAADYLAKKKQSSIVLAFAGKVKEIVADLYQVDAYDKNDMHVRELLQKFGTEVGRSIDPDTWVNYLVRKIDALPGYYNIFVDDVRFSNEERALHQRGFKIIAVQGRINKNLVEKLAKHESELLKDVLADQFLNNSSPLENFYQLLDEKYKEWCEEECNDLRKKA